MNNRDPRFTMTNKPILLLLFFGITKSAFAQVDTVYWSTGEIEAIVSKENGTINNTFFHKNGNISEQILLRDNVKIGERRKYYPSGRVELITYYVQGDYEYSYISYYESCQLSSKGTIKKGIDYEYQYYYETGVLQVSLETLDNGERVHKKFYKSGKLEQIGTYAPLRNGTWKTFYETGELKRTEEFSDGRRIGVWKEYYKNHRLKQTEECIPNTMFRDIKEYHPNGKLKAIGRVNHSFYGFEEKIGSWKEYHDNGALYKSYQFENTLKTGCWITYYKNGYLQEKGLYENGKPMGTWEEFYDNGQLKNTGKYAENPYRMEKEGLWKTYHKNGQLKRTASHYYRGVEGEAREYYQNGNLRCIEQWGCDKPYGRWEYYRRNGKHLKSEDRGPMGC